jgi:3-deoxy-D-manno-octulosonate 8-phosphate phosphatase (KDO 8-P phosphatase)
VNYFCRNIQFLREQRGAAIDELAAVARIPEKEMSLIEIGGKEPLLTTAVQLAQFFSVGLDTLTSIDLSTKHKQAKQIEMLIIDIDGVLTDGGMYYTESGDEFKKFNTKDGLAIKRLANKGMKIAFLSNGKNVKLVKSRAKLLGVQKVYVGSEEKLVVLEEWKKEMKIPYAKMAYIGDDINDFKVFDKVGFTACPADAMESIKQKAHVILSRKGGDACVREWIDKYF